MTGSGKEDTTRARLGPIYGTDEPADELLASAYRETLRLAEEARLESEAPPLRSVRRIRFVLFDRDQLEVHVRVLREVPDGS